MFHYYNKIVALLELSEPKKKLKYVHAYDIEALLKQQPKKSMTKAPLDWSTIVVTWFFVGFIPLAPGTFGSLATYPLYYYAVTHAESLLEVLVSFWIQLVILTIIGWIAIYRYQCKTSVDDHKQIVIDEVLGMLFAFSLCFDIALRCGIYFKRLFNYSSIDITFVMVFLIFRIYDTTKPFFISIIDKHMKNAFGVILDDLLAGFYTYLTILLIYNLILFFK
jgi:phosphatidylglycerophosphatase A